MKEIEEAFKKICWDSTFDGEESVCEAIKEAEALVKETIQNLRKENFELYKALYGVKHPEDV